MVIERGTIWWADLGEPRGAGPGFRRPVVVVQSDAFNRSRIQTVIAVALTSNLRLLDAPGNVLVPARLSGLPKDSVANVSQVVTLDKSDLREQAGRLDGATSKRVSAGLRLVLGV
jgi:mRNA interferase MazF